MCNGVLSKVFAGIPRIMKTMFFLNILYNITTIVRYIKSEFKKSYLNSEKRIRKLK